jgi:hypothetical protein
LLRLPELKTEEGEVGEALRGMEAPESALDAWHDLVAEDILPEDEDAGF